MCKQAGVVPPPRPHQLHGTGGHFDSRNSSNARFAIPPPRPAQDMTATNSQVGQNHSMPRNLAQAPQSFSTAPDDLDMMPSLGPSLHPHEATAQLPKEISFYSAAEKQDSHFGGLKLIPKPPDLETWRERLFNVDEMITLTEEQ